MNLSRGGVCVLAQQAITRGTAVFLRFERIDRSAFAHVRRCLARGGDYEVALQFREGLMLDDRAMQGFDYQREIAAVSWNDPDA